MVVRVHRGATSIIETATVKYVAPIKFRAEHVCPRQLGSAQTHLFVTRNQTKPCQHRRASGAFLSPSGAFLQHRFAGHLHVANVALLCAVLVARLGAFIYHGIHFARHGVVHITACICPPQCRPQAAFDTTRRCTIPKFQSNRQEQFLLQASHLLIWPTNLLPSSDSSVCKHKRRRQSHTSRGQTLPVFTARFKQTKVRGSQQMFNINPRGEFASNGRRLTQQACACNGCFTQHMTACTCVNKFCFNFHSK